MPCPCCIGCPDIEEWCVGILCDLKITISGSGYSYEADVGDVGTSFDSFCLCLRGPDSDTIVGTFTVTGSGTWSGGDAGICCAVQNVDASISVKPCPVTPEGSNNYPTPFCDCYCYYQNFEHFDGLDPDVPIPSLTTNISIKVIENLCCVTKILFSVDWGSILFGYKWPDPDCDDAQSYCDSKPSGYLLSQNDCNTCEPA